MLLAGCYHLLQGLLAIPVVRARLSTKISAPILYPRDSEIKARNLTEDQVTAYYNAQRGHQNNVEFSATFIPMMMAAGKNKCDIMKGKEAIPRSYSYSLQ